MLSETAPAAKRGRKNTASTILCRVISREGGTPPEVFLRTPTLSSGDGLNSFLRFFEKNVNVWYKRTGSQRKRISRFVFLRRPSDPTRTLGLISYVFWEDEFARSFLKEFLARPQSNIRLATASDEGAIFPSMSGLPTSFFDMVERARMFGTREVGLLPIQGKSTLVMVWQPSLLRGYRLIGMVDDESIHEDSQFIRMLMNLTTLGSLLYIALAALFLAKRFLGRVEKLRESVGQIIEEKFEARVAIDGLDELAQVSMAFNKI